MRPRRAESPSEVITLRVSSEERERLKQAAAANCQSMSEFMRDAAFDAASETLEDPDALMEDTSAS